MQNPIADRAPLFRKPALGTLIPIILLLAGLRLGEMPVGVLMDDAVYVEMARSVAEGRGPVVQLNDRDGPWRLDAFPPGFPLLLAPLARLWPASLTVLKVVPFLAWIGLGILAWHVPSRNAPAGLRGAVGLLVLMNPWAMGHAGRIGSDLPFAVFALAGILVYRRCLEGRDKEKGWLILAAVLIAAAVSVRTVGLAALLAVALHLVLRRRWAGLAVFLPAAVLPLTLLDRWSGPRGAGIMPPGTLEQELSGSVLDHLLLIAKNLGGYLGEAPTLLVPVFGAPLDGITNGLGVPAIPAVLGAALGILMLAAVLRKHKPGRRPGVLTLYVVLYGMALLNFRGWPSGVQTRLLIPVLPILLTGLVGSLWPDHRPGWRNRLRAIALAALFLTALGHDLWRVATPAIEREFDPSRGSAWVQDHVAEGDVLMVRMPIRQHVHLRRPVVGFGVADPDSLRDRVERYGVGWIVLGPRPVHGEAETADLAAMIRSSPGRYASAHRDTAGRLEIFSVSGSGP